MPRLNVVTECRACGEPSGGRYCPACIQERNVYTDRQGVSARQYEENDGGQA